MHHCVVIKQPQHMCESIHCSQAPDVAGLAQRLSRKPRHICVLDGGRRDLARLEQLSEGVQSIIRHLGDAKLNLGRTNPALRGDAGKNLEQ